MAQKRKKNPFAAIAANKVKLKKTTIIKDKSGPQLSGYLS